MSSYSFKARIKEVNITRILNEQPATVRAVVVQLPAGRWMAVRGSAHNALCRADIRNKNGSIPIPGWIPAFPADRYTIDENGAVCASNWEIRNECHQIPDDSWLAVTGDKNIDEVRRAFVALDASLAQVRTITVEQL